MKELIRKERIKLGEKFGKKPSSFFVTIALLWRLFDLGTNLMLSKWRLRSARWNGKLVFTNKTPDVHNEGNLELGDVVRIWSNVRKCRLSVKKNATLRIGNNCRINGPTIVATNLVSIGNNCRIAPDVYIMDGDFHSLENRLVEGKSSSIIIEDDAWVATRAMVMKGVTIGKGAVVAAGAVVTKDVAPYTLVGGVPAKFIRNIAV